MTKKKQEYMPGCLVVRWTKSSTRTEQEALLRSLHLDAITWFQFLSYAVVRVPEGEEMHWAEELQKHAIVERAHPNYYLDLIE